MHAGLLTQRIIIKREVRTSDGAGGAAVSLSTVATVRARVEAVRAAERVQSDRVQGVATYLFTIRKPNTFTIGPEDRVIWQNTEFNVSFVPPAYDLVQWVTFEATRGVAQ
jgi:SPP1 family predicted phage head-tail adaptor